jgi:hypothetical protein
MTTKEKIQRIASEILNAWCAQLSEYGILQVKTTYLSGKLHVSELDYHSSHNSGLQQGELVCSFSILFELQLCLRTPIESL